MLDFTSEEPIVANFYRHRATMVGAVDAVFDLFVRDRDVRLN